VLEHSQSNNEELNTSPQIEWPTLALSALIYSGWIAATFWSGRIPMPWLAVIGGILIAWHNSLQHEIIHGHPTPWRRLNTAIGLPPLSLWLPFPVYRDSHLAHHASHDLTHPDADPESRYLDASNHASRIALFVARLQSTLLGRMAFGPFFEVIRFGASQLRRLRDDAPGARRVWLGHLALVSLVVAWLQWVCHFGLLEYLACFVYPGAALSLIRSFAEHRAHPQVERRVAVVEQAPLFGLLFLNNNLHAAHHANPGLAWWRLPAFYRARRSALIEANGGLIYRGYREVFARYFLRPHDQIGHPDFSPSAPEARGAG
jgi:fatty acid desaturase